MRTQQEEKIQSEMKQETTTSTTSTTKQTNKQTTKNRTEPKTIRKTQTCAKWAVGVAWTGLGLGLGYGVVALSSAILMTEARFGLWLRLSLW